MKDMKNEERIERVSIEIKEIASLIRDLKRGREINLDCLQEKVNELGNITYALNDIIYDYELEEEFGKEPKELEIFKFMKKQETA